MQHSAITDLYHTTIASHGKITGKIAGNTGPATARRPLQDQTDQARAG